MSFNSTRARRPYSLGSQIHTPKPQYNTEESDAITYEIANRSNNMAVTVCMENALAWLKDPQGQHESMSHARLLSKLLFVYTQHAQTEGLVMIHKDEIINSWNQVRTLVLLKKVQRQSNTVAIVRAFCSIVDTYSSPVDTDSLSDEVQAGSFLGHVQRKYNGMKASIVGDKTKEWTKADMDASATNILSYLFGTLEGESVATAHASAAYARSLVTFARTNEPLTDSGAMSDSNMTNEEFEQGFETLRAMATGAKFNHLKRDALSKNDLSQVLQARVACFILEKELSKNTPFRGKPKNELLSSKVSKDPQARASVPRPGLAYETVGEKDGSRAPICMNGYPDWESSACDSPYFDECTDKKPHNEGWNSDDFTRAQSNFGFFRNDNAASKDVRQKEKELKMAKKRAEAQKKLDAAKEQLERVNKKC